MLFEISINDYFYTQNQNLIFMKLLKSLQLVALFFLTFQVLAQKPMFRFVQITDMQMGMISKNENTLEEERLYRLAVDEINALKPKFVIITGDFVNSRTDTNQIKAYKKITSLISKRIPIYYIPGNHDVGQKPTAETLDFYFKHYDVDRFAFVHKSVKFIGINSNLINSGIEQEAIQYDWLKKQLSHQPKPSKRTIIFSHHPFFINDINENNNYSNIHMPKRLEYMQLFKENGVSIVFAGHYHNNALAQYDGIEMITTSAVGKPLGKAKSGFRVVNVYKDSIGHKYVELPPIE